MPTPLSLPVSDARRRLSEIVTAVQDPRAFCALTRHGRPVAGVVSIAELRRIWDLSDLDEIGPRNPLTGQRTRRLEAIPRGMVWGPKGLLTYREAAEKAQTILIDRTHDAALLRA